jgi:hypothetical protein
MEIDEIHRTYQIPVLEAETLPQNTQFEYIWYGSWATTFSHWIAMLGYLSSHRLVSQSSRHRLPA